MAVNTQISKAQAIEQELYSHADDGAAGNALAAVLSEYRKACEELLCASSEHIATYDTDHQLWQAHLRVNNAFRREHRVLQRSPDRVVEKRKFEKNYLHFIKASQTFYRQCILNLDARYSGIPKLRKIAQSWKQEAPKTSGSPSIPAALNEEVLVACHQILIHLGDLSRYRSMETEEAEKRKWGPAVGFYKLADELYPDSGHAHNQLAVISREDGDHFRSVYHLYRSLACKKPYAQAQGNLELEFKRIIGAWDKGQLINNHKSSDDQNAGQALIAWFIRLHSKLYKGEEFAAHDELEGEVLSHLAIELKERSLDAVLHKIILINLAAEYHATVQMQSHDPPKNIRRTYFYFLRLNVKTFFVLLQVLQPELERLSEADDVTKTGTRAVQLSDKITAVARRTLPGLRLYSTWFASYWKVLNGDVFSANPVNTLTTVDVQELWKAYAATLTLLASGFPVDQLPVEEYMHEEDTDTIGFRPLTSNVANRLWYSGATLKQKWTDVERNHPNVEMLMRVKDLLIDGLVLTQNNEAPLDLDFGRFIYSEEGVPSELLASPSNQPESSPVLPIQNVDLPLFPSQDPLADDGTSHSVAAPSESASTAVAKDSAMHRMVDDLLGPDDGLDPLPEEDENLPPTPPEQTFEDTTMITNGKYAPAPLNINDLVNSVKNYKPLSPSPGAPMLSTPMGRTGSTSSVRQPVNLPSVPDGQWNSPLIWNRNYNGTPGLASPSMVSGNEFSRSPINGNGIGHVRQRSSNSLLGGDITPNAIRAPRPISGGLGSGAAWGNPSAASPSYWGSGYSNGFGGTYNNGNQNGYGGAYTNGNQNAFATDVNMASPLLFSSYQDKANSSWGRTPPNGQGG